MKFFDNTQYYGVALKEGMGGGISSGHPFDVFEQFFTSGGFGEKTGYSQEPNREESPVEVVATSPPKMKKPTRARQKWMIQSTDAPQQNARTHEEEIALAKGWVDVSENSMLGNSRKEARFWCAVLAYMESQSVTPRQWRKLGSAT
ncbi:hypothetical protein Tco_0935741 [Tanacetum coccineum]